MNEDLVALMRDNPKISWRANNRADGTMEEGFFIAGIGSDSFLLPVEMWTLLDGKLIATSNKAPE